MSLPSDRAEPLTDAVGSPDALGFTRETEDRASYRQIFKATSVIGGAQVISIAIGIARMKVFALLLGPAGVGLFGLLNALMSTIGMVMQMGIGTVGTRQIAEAHAARDHARMALARRALMIAAIVLSVAGGGAVWLLREPLAIYVLSNAEQADAVGWIAIGVGLSVAAMWQSSLIQGMSRMWDLALLRIGGAVLVTLTGLPIIWAFGDAAIPAYVVLMPLASFVLGQVFIARIAKLPPVAVKLPEMAAQWRMFLVLGLPIVVSSVVGMITTVWIQAHVKAELGIAGTGDQCHRRRAGRVGEAGKPCLARGADDEGLRTTIGTAPHNSRVRAISSRPERPGMRTSVIRTAGRSSSTQLRASRASDSACGQTAAAS